MKSFIYSNKFSTSISALLLASFLWSCGGSGGGSAKDENLSATYSDNGTTFKITVRSSGYSNKYYVDGTETKSLSLKEGYTYYFNVEDSSTNNHPLFIGTSSGGGNYSNEYSSGVTGTRTTNGLLTFTVPTDAPSTLYYNCGLHSSMGGVINIIESNSVSTSNSSSSEITEFPSGLQKSYLPQTVEGSTQQREYLVRYPSQPNQSNYPLVFYFHGNGDTAEDFYKSLHEVHELIDNNQFIGIFPQGLEKSWNLGAEASKADDVAWVLRIIDEISEIRFVDSSSVYAVGISNGAGMVNKLAKETVSLKGIAPIVSQQTLELSIIDPFRGVSVFQINGDDDQLIPLQGGFSPQVQHQFVSARESAENWALHSKCATVPVTFEDVWGFYPVQAFVYGNCESNQQVRYHIVEGSGHSGNFGNFALHTAIWNFFRKFPGGD